MTTINQQNLERVNALLEVAKAENKKVEHQQKGTLMTRKWISVFVMFGSWVFLQTFYPAMAKDYLVVITLFALGFGLVYLVFKGIIKKKDQVRYRAFRDQLVPSVSEVMASLEVVDCISLLSELRSEMDGEESISSPRKIYEEMLETKASGVQSTDEDVASVIVSRVSAIPFLQLNL